MTAIINLYGSSGVGKSTAAADLFGLMKKQGYHVELVREWVKKWAWEDKKIGPYDQLYISAKQFRQESMLYGKVDYIITDSPILLGGFYEQLYTGEEVITQTILKYMEISKEISNVKIFNIMLERFKKYDSRGRYETEEQSIKNHEKLKQWLNNKNIGYVTLTCEDKYRAEIILEAIRQRPYLAK